MVRIWECGIGQHPVERALTMLCAAFPDVPRHELLALSVGQRDAFLLALREATFGSQFAGFAQCSHCQERLEFTFDASHVRVGSAPLEALAQEHQLHIEDYVVHVRLPSSADLAAIASCRDVASAQDLLIARCIPHVFLHGDEVARETLLEPVLASIGTQIVELDPQAEMDIVLQCPACGEQWSVGFDIVAFLWSEILTYAKRLLRDVHTLALAYGWHEEDIFAMSAVRRQLYLEMVS